MSRGICAPARRHLGATCPTGVVSWAIEAAVAAAAAVVRLAARTSGAPWSRLGRVLGALWVRLGRISGALSAYQIARIDGGIVSRHLRAPLAAPMRICLIAAVPRGLCDSGCRSSSSGCCEISGCTPWAHIGARSRRT